jgi:large subunit ribosomal protein L3
MQVWPRKRAKRPYVRVRSWPKGKEFLGFPGYKAGMTHIEINDTHPTSLTKGQKVVFPVTIIECPPIKIAGLNAYTKDAYGKKIKTTIINTKLDKELKRKITLPKKQHDLESIQAKDFHEFRAIIYTQPKHIGFKKKPEILEIAVGGTSEEQLQFIKENWSKEINVDQVFKEGDQLDTRSVTKGKGTQGPRKRFGLMLRSHKSEKTKRGPGSLGAWHGNRSYRVAHLGQTGYHQRIEYNKWLVKIDNKTEKINPKGGLLKYGNVKNKYVLLKGSVGGPKKRLITLTKPLRPTKKIPTKAPHITYISLESKQ